MRESDVYRLVTLDDGKADADAILRVFADMASGKLNSDLRFINYFHEVPVSYGAAIQFIENDSVEFLVHEHQGLVIKHDGHTLIKSAHFPKELGVHAYAAYVNVQKKTTILHSFAFAQIRAERREAVRVTVTKQLPVTFSFDGVSLSGKIRDISGTGISLVAAEALSIDVDQAGQLRFALMETEVSAPGRFVRYLKGSDDSYVYVFRMEPDRKTDALIGQFSYQRQIEILKGLKEGLVNEEAGVSLAAS